MAIPSGHRHTFDMLAGCSGIADSPTTNPMAWAVRDGDVAAVPEPASWALMVLGLAVLAMRPQAAARSGLRAP
jgi:hypothetical protein